MSPAGCKQNFDERIPLDDCYNRSRASMISIVNFLVIINKKDSETERYKEEKQSVNHDSPTANQKRSQKISRSTLPHIGACLNTFTYERFQ